LLATVFHPRLTPALGVGGDRARYELSAYEVLPEVERSLNSGLWHGQAMPDLAGVNWALNTEQLALARIVLKKNLLLHCRAS
jgi:hypothetical protein